MPETSLYGESHNLTNVRVLKDPDHVGTYHVFLDGTEVHGVTKLDVSFRPGEHISARMEINSVTKIDHDMLVKFDFDPSSIDECLKFLCLEWQLNKRFQKECLSDVELAIKDSERKNFSVKETAVEILKTLFGI